MSSAINRHHPGASLARLVEFGNLVFVSGTTADNKSASCKVVAGVDRSEPKARARYG
jgi:enamine deaminase RidA (YjgF/YER057c/UK114 family)